MRKRIIGRLRYLRNLEIWNIVSIPTSLIIVMTQLMIFEWQMMVYNIIVMTFIFLQGAIYWDTKHSSLIQKQSRLPDTFRTNFRTLRWFNVVLLCMYPAMSIYGTYSGNLFFATSWWSHSIFLAAIIVHINYYHVQISHDNPTDMRYLVTHQKLRRSPLHSDLYPLSVTISSPIRQVRKSVASTGFSAASFAKQPTTSATQSVSAQTSAPASSTSKSQPIPSLSSSQSQPLPTSKSQPIPSLSSSQSQPIPTSKSQPIPTSKSQPIPTSKSQPIPTLPSSQSQPLPSSKSQPIPTLSSSQSQPLPTSKSQPIPTLSSSQSQPLPTSKSQPIPTLSSSQLQPLPTSKSQPIPTMPSSQSQPLPTLAEQGQDVSDTAKTQPLPVIDEAAILNIVLNAPQSTSVEPIINDSQLAQEFKQQASKKQQATEPDEALPSASDMSTKRVPATTKDKSTNKKSPSVRSRQKPTNEQ